MDPRFKTEIRWRTIKEYVDLETGEMLTEEQVSKGYKIVNKKKITHVYKSVGTIISINECRRDQQGTLF